MVKIHEINKNYYFQMFFLSKRKTFKKIIFFILSLADLAWFLINKFTSSVEICNCGNAHVIYNYNHTSSRPIGKPAFLQEGNIKICLAQMSSTWKKTRKKSKNKKGKK